MATPRLWPALGAVAALGLGLAACTDGGGGPTAPGSTAATAGEASPPVAGAATAQWATVAPADMPLAPYWETLRQADAALADAADDATRVETWNAQQDFIARCMKSQGFTYYPTAFSEGSGGGPSREYMRYREVLPAPLLAVDRGVVEEQGYGSMPDTRQPDTLADDPNQEYVASLSEAESRAYEMALTGVDPDRLGDPVEDGAGCVLRAWDEYPEPDLPAWERSVFGRHAELISAMALVVRSDLTLDPEFWELNQLWGDCMAAKGLDLDPDGAAAAAEAGGGSSGPTDAMRLAIRTGADGEVAPADAHAASLPLDQASLTASGPERAIALADFDCRVETDYIDQLIAIQRRLEQQFVDRHASELAEMTALAEFPGGG
ncbi:MAG: hypothetical protein LBG60_17455 [Bifidobacteriaceae bacterium]|jgi:hypothetical protein|nr:hypothetical protein [Bifidobacteriaceae bacterium]